VPIVGIVGPLGCGKTATLTYFGLLARRDRQQVYSNYWLAFPHIPVTHPFQIVKIHDGRALFDEFWTWASSIAPLRKLQQSMGLINTRSRKMAWELFYTTQRWKNVHNRLRAITDFVCRPQPFPLNVRVPYGFRVDVMEMCEKRTWKFRFELDEVKDLYDTRADIYGYEEILKEAEKTLAKAKLTEFFTGKQPIKDIEEAVDELKDEL
jgi:hypothetical protein